MIVLVSSREKQIIFTNQNDKRDESYIIKIKVDEKMYVSGQTYYDISYTGESKKFIPSEVSVFKNEMTTQMINYLLSDPEDLVKVSGINSQQYRTLIMLNLNRLGTTP